VARLRFTARIPGGAGGAVDVGAVVAEGRRGRAGSVDVVGASVDVVGVSVDVVGVSDVGVSIDDGVSVDVVGVSVDVGAGDGVADVAARARGSANTSADMGAG
jgi:hypothetical protein